MRKVFVFIVFVIIASIVIFYLFFRYSGKSYSGSVYFIKNEPQKKILSMQEIDSLTAAMNYHFTIKNKAVHRSGRDSIRIPVKAEIPSG